MDLVIISIVSILCSHWGMSGLPGPQLQVHFRSSQQSHLSWHGQPRPNPDSSGLRDDPIRVKIRILVWYSWEEMHPLPGIQIRKQIAPVVAVWSLAVKRGTSLTKNRQWSPTHTQRRELRKPERRRVKALVELDLMLAFSVTCSNSSAFLFRLIWVLFCLWVKKP